MNPTPDGPARNKVERSRSVTAERRGMPSDRDGSHDPFSWPGSVNKTDTEKGGVCPRKEVTTGNQVGTLTSTETTYG